MFPSLVKEGRTRRQNNAPVPLMDADGVVGSMSLRDSSNAPVCAVSEPDVFLSGAATPPNLGGEFFKRQLCARLGLKQ